MRKHFDIGYVVSQLLFEPDTEQLRTRLEHYNEALRNIAIAEGDDSYEEVVIVGPALLVNKVPII